MGDPNNIELEMTPLEREVYNLKLKIAEKRQNAFDTSLVEVAMEKTEPISPLKIKIRRTLKGHLTKVCIVYIYN